MIRVVTLLGHDHNSILPVGLELASRGFGELYLLFQPHESTSRQCEGV